MDFSLQNWNTLPLGIIAAFALALGGALLFRAVFRKIRSAQRVIAGFSSLVLLIPGGAGITYSLNDLQETVNTYKSQNLKQNWDNVKNLGK